MHTCEVPIQRTLLYDPVGLLECDAPREGDLEQVTSWLKLEGRGYLWQMNRRGKGQSVMMLWTKAEPKLSFSHCGEIICICIESVTFMSPLGMPLDIGISSPAQSDLFQLITS